MRKALGDKSAGLGRWRMWAAPAVAVAIVLLLIGAGGYALLRHMVEQGVHQAELKWEEERRAIELEANRKVEEAEQQRLAALKAEQERQARFAAEAEAKRKPEEAERQRLAAAKAEQERQARAAAEAEAKRKAEEAEQQRVAAAPKTPPSPPEFPWPPPAASASYVLPKNLFENRRTIGEVVAAIISALERNGYVERSFFRIEAGGERLRAG